MRDTVLAALAARNPSAALDAARQWVEAEPGLADAHWALAQACSAARDDDGARAALDAALALAPDRADLIAARAWLDLGAQRFDAAKAGFDAAVAQDPNQLGAYLPAAHLALARGDHEEAGRLVDYARRIDSEHPHVLLLEGLLAEARGDADAVLPRLAAASERAPEDPLVLSTYGAALVRRGHAAFGEQALRKAAERGAGRGVLVGLLMSQGRTSEALAEAREWAEGAPQSLPARWALAQAAAASGERDEALAVLSSLRATQPAQPDFFRAEVSLRAASMAPDAFQDWLLAEESRVAALPDYWQWRLATVSVDAAPAIVERWRALRPDDAEPLEIAALLAERQGRLDEADALAASALQRDPDRLEALMLRARHAAGQPATSALEALDRLAAAATQAPQRRGLEGWRAVVLHELGRADEALAAWKRAWTGGPPIGIPLPQPEPADRASAAASSDGGAGWLLWSPPGGRLERLVGVLATLVPDRLLADRFGPSPRDDGFNALRVGPDHPAAGQAARWRAALGGRDPVGVIDAVPHWDGWTHATLHGMRLFVGLRDPRDLLINWMAWGSTAGFSFPGPGPAAAWLRLVLEHLLDAEASEPERIVRFDADLFDHDPAAASARLAEALGLADVPPVDLLDALGRRPGGRPADFPPGAWRRHAGGELAPVFAHLEPVAVRLGYPAR